MAGTLKAYDFWGSEAAECSQRPAMTTTTLDLYTPAADCSCRVHLYRPSFGEGGRDRERGAFPRFNRSFR